MKRVLSILLLGLAAISMLPAQATSLPTVQLGTVYNGYTPSGTGPWLQATYDPSTSTLTLTSLLSPGEKVQGGGVTGWAFYMTGGLASAQCLGGICPADPILINSVSSPPGQNLGNYNLGFNWANNANGVFGYGDTAQIKLIFSGDGTTNPFAENNMGWYSYAHVQGISSGTAGLTCSGWIVAGSGQVNTAGLLGTCGGTTTNVPEPNDLGMFGIGLLLVGIFLGLSRRRLFN